MSGYRIGDYLSSVVSRGTRLDTGAQRLARGAPHRAEGVIAVLVALLVFLPASVGALPAAWQNDVNPYLPSVAGQMIIGHTKFTPPGHLLAPWTGLTVFCGYTAAILLAAAIALHRRDA